MVPLAVFMYLFILLLSGKWVPKKLQRWGRIRHLKNQHESGQYETEKQEYSKVGQEMRAYWFMCAAPMLSTGLFTFISHTPLLPHAITHIQSAVVLAGSLLQLPSGHYQDAEVSKQGILPCSTKKEPVFATFHAKGAVPWKWEVHFRTNVL